VVSPDSLDSAQDIKLGRALYNKIGGRTVSASLLPIFNQAFRVTESEPQQHKPAPVLQQEWLQAKVELYSATDDIVRALANRRSRRLEACGEKPLSRVYPADSFRRRRICQC